MRIRTAVAFIIGFAAGLVCLTAVLWFAGPLRGSHSTVPAAASQPPTTVPALPDTSAAAQYAGAPATPHNLPGPPAAQGTASRTLPETAPSGSAGRLVFPVRGIDPRTVRDTFNDARASHMHEALDIPAPRGTAVLAVAEGNVAKLFTSKQGGLTVYQFDDSQTWCFYYAHLDHYAPELKEGMLLRAGEVLGFVGNTGDAPPDAPHLHFALFRLGPEKHWWQGTAVDPFPFLTGARQWPP